MGAWGTGSAGGAWGGRGVEGRVSNTEGLPCPTLQLGLCLVSEWVSPSSWRENEEGRGDLVWGSAICGCTTLHAPRLVWSGEVQSGALDHCSGAKGRWGSGIGRGLCLSGGGGVGGVAVGLERRHHPSVWTGASSGAGSEQESRTRVHLDFILDLDGR